MLLVTGGAGFIGRHYLHFHETYYPEEPILCVDALTYAADPDFIKTWATLPNHHFIHGRIEDMDAMENLFRHYNITGIINFAAESHVDRSLQDATPFMRTNVEGVQVLLALARKYGIQRFHQVSTDEVYGEMPNDPFIKATEDFPLHPRNPYAASKASADLIALSYYEAYGLHVTISRGSNTYGAYQHKEKFIPKAITNLLSGSPVPVYGDGLQIRDWMHVEDHVRGIDTIFRHGQAGEIYNLSAHEEKTNLAVIEDILHHFALSKEGSIAHVTDRLGHDKRYAVSTEKIETTLAWKSIRHWSEAFPLTCESYK